MKGVVIHLDSVVKRLFSQQLSVIHTCAYSAERACAGERGKLLPLEAHLPEDKKMGQLKSNCPILLSPDIICRMVH